MMGKPLGGLSRRMLAYVIRRLALMVPTLFGIMVINFVVIQAAPGGPVEQMIAQIQGRAVDATARLTGQQGDTAQPSQSQQGGSNEKYRGARGLDPEFIKQIEKQFGFDKPMHERFVLMIGNYLRFDFGSSYFRDQTVFNLILEKMPVSITLGLWTTLLVYLVSIPLGIAKATRDGTRFDVATSAAIIVGYAIPSFLFAVLLIVVFAGGRYLDWFPLRGLWSDQWSQVPWSARLTSFSFWTDYLWHITLPVVAMVMGGFATLTMLTKNSFLEEINKQYVLTARAKGLTERAVLYGHVFRNAMLIVVAGFPGAFVSVLFSGSLLIEIIFSLDGLGLLGFEAAINRDYPVMFATLYFFTLLGLILGLISDLMYVLIDPRIDFARREV
jgi:microcin C transport system permease protein